MWLSSGADSMRETWIMSVAGEVDVVVLAVHGMRGRSVTTDLVKSGAVYGTRVQLFDPNVSLLAMLSSSGVDLAAFAAAGDADQNEALARAMVALDELDIDSLSGLADRGLVQLVDPLKRDEIGTGRSVEIFLQRFADLINGSGNFVMLDSHAGRVFSELRALGKLVVEPGARRRSHEASTANGLLGRLPNFRMASLDDVLGIRESLADALPRFRGGVAELAATFDSDMGAPATFDEIAEAWRAEVAPALNEIEELTKDSRFLRSLLLSSLNSGSTLAGGGMGVVTALTSDMDGLAATLSTLAGAGIGATSDAIKEAITAKRDLKRHKFYFLHQVDQLLAR